MDIVTILTILVILVGPVLAVLISLYVGNRISDRRARRQEKFLLLSTLVAWQWRPVSEESVKAMNAIDLYFHDVPEVRVAWRDYFDSLGRRDLSDEEKIELWKNKRIRLIHAIAKDLGFEKTMSQLDFDRIYSPEGLAGDWYFDPDALDRIVNLLKDRQNKLREERTSKSTD